MNEHEKIVLAAAVIELGKNLTPDRFPAPSEDVIKEWAIVLGSINVPRDVWLDAVRLWATELAGNRMVTPRELKDAAKMVLSRWESDPVKRQQLNERRERLREERDRQIAAGTFGAVRGHRAIAAPEKESVAAPDTLMELRKNLARKKGVL